jgi:predicted small integral membrane protein
MTTAIERGELVLTLGFAVWLLIGVVNDFSDLRGVLHFIESFMKMEPLEQDPPVPTSIKSHKVESPLVHRLGLIFIILAKTVLGIAFAIAAWLILRGAEPAARVVASYAFAGMMALWFVFTIAGTWFGYWIRQGDLQRTHLLLLGLSMLGFMIMAA